MNKKFTVVGNPISHSLSPIMHKRIFEMIGLRAEYEAVKCEAHELQIQIERLRSGELDGINVTIPFKSKIMAELDGLNVKARQLGAVNCLVRSGSSVLGFNTDWFGFSMLLKSNNIPVSNKEFIILGAGGVSRGVLYTLTREGAGVIKILNRDYAKCRELVDSAAGWNSGTRLTAGTLSGSDLHIDDNSCIINCTPLGMWPNVDQMPIGKELIRGEQLIIDTIYTPLETKLLQTGKKSGAQIINGLRMFIYQGLASLDIWLQEDIAGKTDIPELEQYLIDYLKDK